MRKSFENHPSSFLLCGDMILVPWVIAATKFDYPLVIVMYVCVYRERRLSFESRMAFLESPCGQDDRSCGREGLGTGHM